MGTVESSSIQVVLLAAGKGVRMRSELPKVLHRVCGQSLVERVLRASSALPVSRTVVVVGYRAEEVRAEVEKLKTAPSFAHAGEIHCVEQRSQRGTGDAARTALEGLDPSGGPVLIIPGDCPLLTGAQLKELIRFSSEQRTVLSFISCEPADPSGYGRVIRDHSGKVTAIIEHKDCTPEQLKIGEINSSIYLVDYNFLKESLATLESNNAQGELYLTDIVGYGVRKAVRLDALSVGRAVEILGANSREELSDLERLRRKQICSHWMNSGVSFEDPAATYIDEEVRIGQDSFIGAGTRLRGTTVLGERTIIDGNSSITDSQIGDGVHVKLSCVISEAKVANGVDIGPFAHLRPGTVLAEKVRIGNFVETKQAALGVGAKANHLSYIGDASIGEGSNIGAGTITCNYDGEKKSKTTIGNGVFIGSNSCLVAPVTIGEGAFVGAGSTITEDVPGGALGLGRERQTNIEGWVARKKRSSKPAA